MLVWQTPKRGSGFELALEQPGQCNFEQRHVAELLEQEWMRARTLNLKMGMEEHSSSRRSAEGARLLSYLGN